jgi:hypothetical protein
MDLYYESFNYQPSTSDFSGFSSNLPKYYSILDNDFDSFNSTCGCQLNVDSGSQDETFYGKKVKTPSVLTAGVFVYNSFVIEYNNPSSTQTPQYYNPTLNIGAQNKGYFNNEIVEGGSLMIMNSIIRKTIVYEPEAITAYISSIYPLNTSINYPQSIASSRKLLMRSDRLPASTQNNENCGSYYLLQNNQSLGMYIIPKEGVVDNGISSPFASMSQGIDLFPTISSSTVSNELVNSLNNCVDSVPLKCYGFSNNEFTVSHGECEKGPRNKSIWSEGCYKLITTVLLSIPKDFEILGEWLARTNITFGACRNVFSHTFTNNWINGSLYAFAFKNNKVFDSQNRPTSLHCNRVVYFDELTNNFYYRSSPYHSGGTQEYFCGSPSPVNSEEIQKKNLKYPTTLIDLGPRSSYLQEIIMSDDYDGYVVNKLNTTTFGDVSDLLNIFIISRLANTEFIALIFGIKGANIFNYFNKRRRLQVDADYAQMISINSEFGVAEFESENYPAIQNAQDPIYFNGGNVADGVFGIFFSSDTQIRDFITPKRTIISPTVPPIDDCAYNYFNVFTQNVPFYQWEIFKNNDIDNLFGSQSNTWKTDALTGSSFFQYEYQKMDRINPNSRYLRTVQGASNQSYLKGYIWGYDNALNPPQYSANIAKREINSPQSLVYSVGAPFYFYFGLKKGASAWDRFARKWLNLEEIVE